MKALSIYFADATLTSAFVARWCAGSKPETHVVKQYAIAT
jgi:hypothetical protein